MNQTAPIRIDEPFAERVEILADELRLAFKFDRPSILFAVYQSRYVMMDAMGALTEQLKPLQIEFAWLRIEGERDADIPIRLSERPADERRRTVYLIDGLQYGQDAALRALNIRREYFVENRLRVILWLTESEAESIPLRAPDFWRFRHRVVDFFDRVHEHIEPQRAAELGSQLAWEGFKDTTLRENTDAKIELRLALLQDLPADDETLGARAELEFTLGGLYRAKRDYEKSIAYFQSAIEIAAQIQDTRLKILCYNGLGNVYRALKRYDDAIATYQYAIALDPNYAAPHYNLGNVYADLKRYDDAIAEFQRAIVLDPSYAYPYNGLGIVYRDLKRYDDAEDMYHKAIELDPTDPNLIGNLAYLLRMRDRFSEAETYYRRALELDPQNPRCYLGLVTLLRQTAREQEALALTEQWLAVAPNEIDALIAAANLSRKLGNEQKTAEYISLARAHAGETEWYARACIEAVAGNSEAALDSLKRASEQDDFDREWAARDPDFEWIREEARFKEIVSGGDSPLRSE